MTVIPIGAMICTIITTLTMLGFCMGMGANASPSAIAALKMWMVGLSVLSLAGIVAGLFLMRSQPNLAAGLAILPAIIIGVIFVISLLK